MPPVQALDILTRIPRPVRYNVSSTLITSRFIRELPSEDSGAIGEAGYDGFDICTILGLSSGGIVPGRRCGIEVCVVGWHSAVVRPVVDERNYKLDVVFFSRTNDGIEALKTIRT